MTHKFQASHDTLHTTWRALQGSWHALRDIWRDRPARDFEQKSWPPFEQSASAVLRELDALHKLCLKARREVR